MKQYIKLCAIGIAYGFLPVVLAWVLVRNLWTIGAVVCKLIGLEPAVTQQITQALGQLQAAKLVLPWLFGALLALLCVGVLLLTKKHRKLRKAMIVTGCVLLLPLTLTAFCLAVVNDIRVWNVLGVLLPMLKAL